MVQYIFSSGYHRQARWPGSIGSVENGCSSCLKSQKLPLECIFFVKYASIISMLLLLRGDFAGKKCWDPVSSSRRSPPVCWPFHCRWQGLWDLSQSQALCRFPDFCPAGDPAGSSPTRRLARDFHLGQWDHSRPQTTGKLAPGSVRRV